MDVFMDPVSMTLNIETSWSPRKLQQTTPNKLQWLFPPSVWLKLRRAVSNELERKTPKP